MTNYREQMMQSWRINAEAWTQAIRDRQKDLKWVLYVIDDKIR